jgi:hypothetical protein
MTTLPPAYIKHWLNFHEAQKNHETIESLKQIVQSNKRIIPEAYATDPTTRDELLSLLNIVEIALYGEPQ